MCVSCVCHVCVMCVSCVCHVCVMCVSRCEIECVSACSFVCIHTRVLNNVHVLRHILGHSEGEVLCVMCVCVMCVWVCV